MGVLDYFGSKFFEPISHGKQPVLGQLVWTPVPMLAAHPWVIEASRAQAASHSEARARWVPMTDSHFKKRDYKELPILNMRLGMTEEVIAFKAKKRPGIVVGVNSTVLGGLKNLPPHHEESRLVVAPIYGIATDDDKAGFSEIMAARVRHLFYLQYFPFAAWKETRSPKDVHGCCSLLTGVVRFDRLQFPMRSPPGCVLVPLKVSGDVLAMMHSMLWAYLHGTLSAEMAELRQMIIEDAPDEIGPRPAIRIR